MQIEINYGNGVCCLPKKAAKRILQGSASTTETRVLLAILDNPPSAVSTTESYIFTLSQTLNITEQKVENALNYWRGSGVITINDEPTKTESTDQKTDEDKENQKKDEEPKPIILPRGDAPKYSPDDISAMLKKDGERLKRMIDECQRIMGFVFSSTDINVFLAMCEYMGIEPDYVVTAVAYFNKKRPGCKIRYIEKAVLSLVDQGIETLNDLDLYVKDMEQYDIISSKIRSLAGLGRRSFTKKENDAIHTWTHGYKYNEEIIEFAYEITVNNTGEFSFNYANTVLENWYNSGVKTLADAKAENEKFREENTLSKKKTKKTTENQSFNLDNFYQAALEKSKEKMAAEVAERNRIKKEANNKEEKDNAIK